MRGGAATAGFPVVATTSGGVAASLGYSDHEVAPAEEMLGAAARIVRGVDLPVTVDAELVQLGVARISYGSLLYRQAMEQFGTSVAQLSTR